MEDTEGVTSVRSRFVKELVNSVKGKESVGTPIVRNREIQLGERGCAGRGRA
jgi:hypothetical protein